MKEKKALSKYKNWDDYFIDMAELVASKSKDPSTKCGVVIVGEDNELLSSGFNGFPRGVKDNKERYLDRPTKLVLVEHAERNAVYNCARNGIKTKGARIYTSFGACCCHECAKAIVQAGIAEIIGKKQGNFAEGRWKESLDNAEIILKEGGVLIREIL